MAWHKCSRYWQHGAVCPVRGMPGHQEDDEEQDDQEDQKIPPVLIPERVSRPAEPGSIVAVAEAIVREVQTRQVVEPSPVPVPGPVKVPSPPVLVPDWVPSPAEIVVPPLFPSPSDVVAEQTLPPFVAPPVDRNVQSTVPVPPSIGLSIGDKAVEGVIAAGMGVAIGIVTVATGGAAVAGVTWMSRIVTISRILRTLSPQVGAIGLPSARTMLIAAGGAAVRMAAGKIPDRPPDKASEAEAIDDAMGMVEELVCNYVYPTAAERTVSISRALAGRSAPSTSLSEPIVPEVTKSATSSNPFGDWNDAFMAPGMYGPPPAEPSSTLATGAGAGGYLYDFGQYLNSQLGSLENAGGSPPPTTY